MTTQSWRIAAIPGDGIGAEVMESALAALQRLREITDLQIEWETLPWPSTAYHRQHAAMMPANALQQLQAFDAVLLGALGDPGPASDRDRYVLPDGVSLAPLLEIRKGFDLWACERPARLFPGARQYLADPRAREVDMLVIRENSEGEYVNQGGRLHRGLDNEVATQLEVFTRPATERLMRHAFRRAEQRAESRRQQGAQRQFTGDGGPLAEAQVCLVTKRNALPHWGELYCEVFASVHREYAHIATHHELVDAACMKFVQAPWQFDVVVASNLHGDILTDLAAVLSGGMGVAPSANINPDNREMPALFEPTHGTAPDIAGQGVADPRAMLLTTAMMLDWMGETCTAARDAARQLQAAVVADMAAADAEKRRNTQSITADVVAHLSG